MSKEEDTGIRCVRKHGDNLIAAGLSTCVRVVAKITPKVPAFAPVVLDRERRAKVQFIVVPRIDLRLVDQHLGVAEVHAARPGAGGRRAHGTGLHE